MHVRDRVSLTDRVVRPAARRAASVPRRPVGGNAPRDRGCVRIVRRRSRHAGTAPTVGSTRRERRCALADQLIRFDNDAFHRRGTPNGFIETVPFRGASLPSQYLSINVRTNNEERPETTVSFRPDDLSSRVSALDDGRKITSEIDGAARTGCVPRQGYYH